jgi:hypothetical protein
MSNFDVLCQYPKGYIILNTNYLPTNQQLYEAPNLLNNLDNSTLKNADYIIESDEQIEFVIGGQNYYMDAGKYFLPFILFCDFKINNRNKCKMYTCILKKNVSLCVILKYRILIKNLKIKNSDNVVIYQDGMYGSFSKNNLTKLLPSWKPLYYKKIEPQNELNNTYTCFIYHENIEDVRKDQDVTKYLLDYDKDIVGLSYPPCIAITYTNNNYLNLKEILDTKYSIKLHKKEPNLQRRCTTKEEQEEEIITNINKIKENENLGFITFVLIPDEDSYENIMSHIVCK